MAESKGKKLKKEGTQSQLDARSSSSDSASESDVLDRDDQIGRGVGTASITVNRDEFLMGLRDLNFDRNQLQLKNNILHRRLAEYYKKRKLEHVLKPLEGSMDLEEKYEQKLFVYEELKQKEEREIATIKAKIHTVEMQYKDRLDYAETKFDGLQHLEQSTGTGLIYSKKGKPISDKTVHRLLTLQRRKCEQSSALCLRYLRVRNAVSELDAITRKLEKLGPGLYVAEFEQLDIDHQNYMTKIEEREDELINNRGKCTEHNQMLAHIREKMHHTDEVIGFTECDLGDAEMEWLRAREDLGNVKGRRDRLRWSLDAERVKAGLLTRKDLLRDFEEATDKVVILREKKKELEAQIEETTRQLRDARSKMQLHRATNDDTEQTSTDWLTP